MKWCPEQFIVIIYFLLMFDEPLSSWSTCWVCAEWHRWVGAPPLYGQQLVYFLWLPADSWALREMRAELLLLPPLSVNKKRCAAAAGVTPTLCALWCMCVCLVRARARGRPRRCQCDLFGLFVYGAGPFLPSDVFESWMRSVCDTLTH